MGSSGGGTVQGAPDWWYSGMLNISNNELALAKRFYNDFTESVYIPYQKALIAYNEALMPEQKKTALAEMGAEQAQLSQLTQPSIDTKLSELAYQRGMYDYRAGSIPAYQTGLEQLQGLSNINVEQRRQQAINDVKNKFGQVLDAERRDLLRRGVRPTTITPQQNIQRAVELSKLEALAGENARQRWEDEMYKRKQAYLGAIKI